LSTPPDPAHWSGEDVELAEVEGALSKLRAASAPVGGSPDIRTSVMTHAAWVPAGWEDQARAALSGMAEAHPSRAILLFPDPDSGRNRIDADVSLERYPIAGADRNVCSEVIELRLEGTRAKAPASVLAPLLISDLPVFVRWRGEPTWESQELEQLVGIADRLIVDSTEWEELPYPYSRLAELFGRTAVSDIAWARTARWRTILASLWPDIADVGTVRVEATAAQAHLIAGWLRSRLGRPDIALEHVPSDLLRGIALDGKPVPFPPGDRPSASATLSEELDRFTRDPVYEAAVLATTPA
jgi:hypothetical protein